MSELKSVAWSGPRLWIPSWWHLDGKVVSSSTSIMHLFIGHTMDVHSLGMMITSELQESFTFWCCSPSGGVCSSQQTASVGTLTQRCTVAGVGTLLDICCGTHTYIGWNAKTLLKIHLSDPPCCLNTITTGTFFPPDVAASATVNPYFSVHVLLMQIVCSPLLLLV